VTRAWMALAALAVATRVVAQETPRPPRPARAPRAVVAPPIAPAAVAPAAPAVPAAPVAAVTAAAGGPTGWLGIGISCSHCSLYRQTGREAEWIFREPPTVMWVDNEGPAYRAGLRSGDTLTAINGAALTSQEGGRAFARVEPGQTVRLTYRRDGRERQVEVTAVERPETRAYTEAMSRYNAHNDTQMQRAQEQMRRAQEDMRRLQEQLREQQRAQLDSSRRQVMAAESTLRTLAREQARAYARAWSFGGADSDLIRTGRVPKRATGIGASRGYAYAYTFPLRYSGRIGDLVNVEARAPGPVNVSEEGDSLIVVTAGDVVVKVTRRAQATPQPARER